MSEVELLQQVAMLKAVIEGIPDPVFVKDTEGRYLFLNSAAAKVIGKPIGEIIGKDSYQIFPRDAADRLKKLDAETMSRHERIENEIRVDVRGRTRTMISTRSPYVDEDGEIAGVIGIAHDVTDQRRAEEGLRESEARFAAVIDHSPTTVFLKDAEGRYLFVNKRYEEWLGTPAATVLGKTPHDVFPKESADRFSAADRSVLETGEVFEGEMELPLQDGGSLLVLVVKFPITDAGGKIVGVGGINVDVTARLRAEERLLESEARLRAIMDSAPAAIVLKDMEGRYISCNEQWMAWNKLTLEEVFGKTAFDIYPQEMAENLVAADHIVLTTRDKHEQEISRRFPDGITRVVLVIKYPVFDGSGDIVGVGTNGVDITERKRAEEALQKAHDEFETRVDARTADLQAVNRALKDQITKREQAEERADKDRRRMIDAFESITDGAAIFDTEDRLVMYSKNYREKTPETRDSLVIGTRFEDLMRSYAKSGRILEAIGREDEWVAERCAYHRNFGAPLIKLLSDGRWIMIGEHRTEDGDTLLVRTDITERKRMEEEARQRQAELAHISRLSTMGEMATSFAHELNQPLSAISNYAQGCVRRLRAGNGEIQEIVDVMTRVAEQAERAGEIIRRIRGFVRKSSPEKAGVDVNAAIREVIELLETEAYLHGVSLELNLAESLPFANGDPIQVQQVILNIARNGVEAMSESRSPVRRLSVQTLVDDRLVEVVIRDTGPGVSRKSADQLFEPFVTTKPDGLGMGLSISRSIVESFGGRLSVTTDDEPGTAFTFALPVFED